MKSPMQFFCQIWFETSNICSRLIILTRYHGEIHIKVLNNNYCAAKSRMKRFSSRDSIQFSLDDHVRSIYFYHDS